MLLGINAEAGFIAVVAFVFMASLVILWVNLRAIKSSAKQMRNALIQ